MGVFQRKADQSVPSPPTGPVKRRSGVEKRRLSHPTSEQGLIDSEKWPPTLPEEEGEADIVDEKVSVKADKEFSVWTPDGVPGNDDGTEIRLPLPPLPPPLPPLDKTSPPPSPPTEFAPFPPFPPPVPPPPLPPSIPLSARGRSNKDPYAKRKAIFDQRAKLAPINERESGGESDSARSSRASAHYENFLVRSKDSLENLNHFGIQPPVRDETSSHEDGGYDNVGFYSGKGRSAAAAPPAKPHLPPKPEQLRAASNSTVNRDGPPEAEARSLQKRPQPAPRSKAKTKPPPSEDPPTVVTAIPMEVQTCDTGVGPSATDVELHPSDMAEVSIGIGTDNPAFDADDSDLQREIELATGMLDEVVFGKGRSTQTGDSLRFGGDKPNHIVNKINRINRPISDCIVVDSSTGMDDPGPDIIAHAQLPPSQTPPSPPETPPPPPPPRIETLEQVRTTPVPAKVGMTFDDSFSRSMGSDGAESVLSNGSEDGTKPRSGKVCVVMVAIFIVVVLGIVAAGVIIYFVDRSLQPKNQDTTSYYLGMQFPKIPYVYKYEQEDSMEYTRDQANICTMVKMAFDMSMFKSSYSSCSVRDFRYTDDTLVAHVMTSFLSMQLETVKDKSTSIEEDLRMSIRVYVQAQSPDDPFRLDENRLRVVRTWQMLSDFGTNPNR